MKQRKVLKTSVFCAIYIAVIAVCVTLDQLTKLWIFDGLLGGDEQKPAIRVLGTFLQFRAIYNEGAAFGIGSDDGANIVFFIVTVIGLPVFSLLLWRSRKRSVWGQIGFSFIIGGTIGNAIDRAFVANESGAFFAGKVRDFISFSIFPPIFNVADSFLVIGVIMAILAVVFFDPDCLWNFDRKKEIRQTAAGNDNSQSCPSDLPQNEATSDSADNVSDKNSDKNDNGNA